MREGISDPTGRNPRIVWTGAILVSIGISVLLAAAEWFATFDACVANPTCNAGVPTTTLEGYLALMIAGVGLLVTGVMIAMFRARDSQRRAMILWL